MSDVTPLCPILPRSTVLVHMYLPTARHKIRVQDLCHRGHVNVHVDQLRQVEVNLFLRETRRDSTVRGTHKNLKTVSRRVTKNEMDMDARIRLYCHADSVVDPYHVDKDPDPGFKFF